jgi:hypothetical protein
MQASGSFKYRDLLIRYTRLFSVQYWSVPLLRRPGAIDRLLSTTIYTCWSIEIEVVLSADLINVNLNFDIVWYTLKLSQTVTFLRPRKIPVGDYLCSSGSELDTTGVDPGTLYLGL